MSKMRLFVVISLAFAALAAPIGTATSAATSIQSIIPSQGPITGGTQVTIFGFGFTGTNMTFDNAAITPISASDTQIIFQTPAHSNGIASVKLSGNGPNAYAEFLYLPPSLTSLPAGYITTIMGIGQFRGDGRLATNAVIDSNEPGLVIASDGSIYLSEHNQNVIRRVRTDGIIERYAGTGTFGDTSAGGLALNLNIGPPRGLAFDSLGNLLIAGITNTTTVSTSIRRIDAQTGIMTTLYGVNTAGFSGDGGPATSAQFNDCLQITFDGLGNLYVLDRLNVRIRKINTLGIITTIAGTGVTGFSGDGGPATQATFDTGTNDWGGLGADSQGNVYLADSSNARVRRIDGATGIITTFVADVGRVIAVLTDSSDNVYVGSGKIDSTSPRILKFSSTGQLLQSWGVGYGFSEDGTAIANAQTGQITRMALDASGNIVFTEECSMRIRRINVTTGLLETIAGMGPHIIGATGPALATNLNNDGMDLLFLPSGDLLTAEGSNLRIRKLDQQGNVSAYAGNGFMGIGGRDNVPALEAFMYPIGLGLLLNGDILMVNTAGISRIDSAGIIHAVNNLHQYGFSGDGGPASAAVMDEPWDVNMDAAGNIYIADANNNRIRRIDAQTGIINTVAGSGDVNGFEHYGNGSYCGDGGPATSACLNTPYGIAIAPDGTMYIGENGQRIRKVTPEGIISTFFSEDGGGRLRLSSAGNLFMPPYRIQPNGHAYKFVFPNPDQSANIEDGVPARSVRANYLGGLQGIGVAIDSEGNLYIADSRNRRIRAIRYGAVIAEAGSTVTASGGNNQSTAIRTAFPMVLQVTLKSPEGTLENGIRVDFAAPASGASCTFPGGSSTYSTLTNIVGQASATCTANAQLGSYSVTATPLALGQSASFSLTNALQGCTYNISPSSYAFNALSNTGTVTITPSASTCTWTATSNDSWITITSSANGTGNGTVSYSITASSDTARIGTITIGGQTHRVNQARWIYSNSIGTRNSIKITDMSGTLSSSGAAIPVAAWDVAGNSIPESPTAPTLTLSSNGTTTISGTDLRNRFPTGTPISYALSADSSKYIITNVKISADGTLNVPNGYTSETTKFVANSVGQRNSIKITDMSGSLSTSGADITVRAWNSDGIEIPESGSAASLKLLNHGTTIIPGSDLAGRFTTGTPMSYEFTVGSTQYVITNVKSSADGTINIPYAYTSGTTNFVANSIGLRNTIKITDVSGSLSSSGAAITIGAWDENGNALSTTAVPLTLLNRGTTSIDGTTLAARFSGTPMSYEFTVGSSKYIVTNVKRSSDRTINIPAVYYSGTTMYASNDISSRSTIKITDSSGTLTSPAAITVNAWDVNGISIPESGSATPLPLVNNGTSSIDGTTLAARFSGTPMSYEFTIGSTKYLVTNVKSSTDGTITIPSVYTSGVAGGI